MLPLIQLRLPFGTSIYIYIYIYIHVHVYIYCIYTLYIHYIYTCIYTCLLARLHPLHQSRGDPVPPPAAPKASSHNCSSEATTTGFTQRSHGVSVLLILGHKNRCWVVCSFILHNGHRGDGWVVGLIVCR